MKLPYCFMGVVILSSSISACSWDPDGVDAQKKMFAERAAKQKEYDRAVAQEKIDSEKRVAQRDLEFTKTHPEVLVGKISPINGNSPKAQFQRAMNSFGFVTRYPDQQTLDNIYVNIGGYNLTGFRVFQSINAYRNDCERVSAYSGKDISDECLVSLARSINDFTAMVRNRDIPEKTKLSAINDASYGVVIDFEHAARLANMHKILCDKKGGVGYVEMVTVAVPCSGRGDVLSSYAARVTGAIN